MSALPARKLEMRVCAVAWAWPESGASIRNVAPVI
jgi:hypothetical protein